MKTKRFSLERSLNPDFVPNININIKSGTIAGEQRYYPADEETGKMSFLKFTICYHNRIGAEEMSPKQKWSNNYVHCKSFGKIADHIYENFGKNVYLFFRGYDEMEYWGGKQVSVFVVEEVQFFHHLKHLAFVEDQSPLSLEELFETEIREHMKE